MPLFGRSLLVICVLITYSQAFWLENLLNPHLSFWDTVDPKQTVFVMQNNTGFSSSSSGPTMNGYIAAFGDFNADKYTDVFVVGDVQVSTDPIQSLNVYVWNYDADSFTRQEQANAYMKKIIAVVPSDYNYDGSLDVLLQGYNEANETITRVYFGDKNGFAFNTTLNETSSVPFLLMDANMDMHVDLFGVYNGQRTFWINDGSGNFDITTIPFPSGGPNQPVAAPHSNAFVDIDGDCLSDLVIISSNAATGGNTMEIWVNSNNGTAGFTFSTSVELPVGARQISFADMDRDGTIDFVFPLCTSAPDCTESQIYIGYNDQPPMCTSITGTSGPDGCTESDDICEESFGYTLPTITVGATTAVNFTVTNLGISLYVDYNTDVAPNTLNIGDYNKDGYPDVSVLVKNGNVTQMQLWENVGCDASLCSTDAINAGRRVFQHDPVDVNIVNTHNAFAGCFFDLDEDGTLDFIVLADSAIGGETTALKSIWIYKNEIDYKTYFMKITGLNGVCVAWCSGENRFPDPKPIGVNQPGTMYKIVWADNDSDKRVAGGVQLTQSAYLSLQQPFAYLGLSEESNYVQYIYMGVPNLKKHFHAYTDIVPNTQLRFIPSPVSSPFLWSMDILMRPSGMTFYTFVVCICTCIVLAIASFLFGLQERRQDKIEAEEKRHLFTF